MNGKQIRQAERAWRRAFPQPASRREREAFLQREWGRNVDPPKIEMTIDIPCNPRPAIIDGQHIREGMTVLSAGAQCVVTFTTGQFIVLRRIDNSGWDESFLLGRRRWYLIHVLG